MQDRKSKRLPNKERIVTIEDLIEFCKVDTSVWEPKRGRVNSWEVGTREATAGLVQIKVPLSRIEEDKIDDRLLSLLDTELALMAPKKFSKFKQPEKGNKGRLMEVSIPDYVGTEVLARGDSEAAISMCIMRGKQKYSAMLADLLSKTANEKISRILFPVNTAFGDLKLKKAVKNQWSRVFLAEAQLLAETIETLAQVAPVDVVMVNTRKSKPYLGIYLSKWFKNHPTVNVDQGLKVRKYYTFGNNLIGLTCDKTLKAAMLPTIMSTESQNLWSKAKYSEIHYGEASSNEKGKEYNGVSVKQINGLMLAEDLLPKKNQVVVNTNAEAYFFNSAGGMDTTYYAG